jgi:hypothetical protein
MGDLEMIDTILQPLEHGFIGFGPGASQQFLDIRVELTQQLTPFIIHGFRIPKFIVELFEKLAKFLVSHGKVPPSVRLDCKPVSNSILQRNSVFEPLSKPNFPRLPHPAESANYRFDIFTESLVRIIL